MNSGNGSNAPPHSRPLGRRWKPILARAAWGGAALVAGLQAGAASALSFSFSFSGTGRPVSPATVTGIVSGLADNLPNQKTGLTVTITSATNTPPGGWGIFTDAYSGSGFDVVAGQITGVDVIFKNTPLDSQYLSLGTKNVWIPQLFDYYINSPTNFDNTDITSKTLRFTPLDQARVPGPLPLFGAAAAFGWSRRLRRRIQSPL